METSLATEDHATCRMLSLACATALAVGITATLPQPARAEGVTPPVPSDIEVPTGNRLFLVGHAFGTQNYICLPSPSGFAWTLFGPQANLFNDDDRQVMTHFLSPNPDESGTLRATWQHSRDTSAIWGLAIGSSSDPGFVAPWAIPWLLLRVVGADDGPAGGDRLTPATFIQRLNTGEGLAPSTGCAVLADVGKRAFVPYTADYYFYRKARGHADDKD